jgi:hypothetical protein
MRLVSAALLRRLAAGSGLNDSLVASKSLLAQSSLFMRLVSVAVLRRLAAGSGLNDSLLASESLLAHSSSFIFPSPP